MSTLPPGVVITPIDPQERPLDLRPFVAFADRIDKQMGLPPIVFSPPEHAHLPRIRRAEALTAFVDQFYGAVRLTARAAIRLAAREQEQWIRDGEVWDHPGPFHCILNGVTERLFCWDKRLWLRVLTEHDSMMWDLYHFYLVRTITAHAFTRAELVPVIASPDPQLRKLGLKLMAATKELK